MERPFGIIDADGHITETIEQIRYYVEEPYRSRGGQAPPFDDPKIRGRGAGARSFTAFDLSLGGTLGTIANDAEAWLAAMDEGGMEKAVLFPTNVGFSIPTIQEPDVATATCRAYNRFMYQEFLRKSDRLFAVALLPMHDIGIALDEYRRCVHEYGMVGAMLPAGGPHAPLGASRYFPLYELAQERDTMVAVHSGSAWARWLVADDFPTFSEVNTFTFPVGLFRQFVSMLFSGIPELFPSSRIAWMEAGCGWVPYWMERIDEKWELRGEVESPVLKRRPSDYVRNGEWYFHTEAGEQMLPYVISVIGDERLFFASDFPHWDSSYPRNIDELLERPDLSNESKRRVLRENALRLYRLS